MTKKPEFIQMPTSPGRPDTPASMKDAPRLTKANSPGHVFGEYMSLTTFSESGDLSKHLRLVVEGEGAEIAIEVFGVRMTYHANRQEMLDIARWLDNHVPSYG